MNADISTSSMPIPYPWQQQAWERIQQQIEQDKIPHAVLLSGQQGIGKWHFAESLADYLLCLSPKADLACGQCRSCQLMKAGTHPDKKWLVPEEAGKAIKVDQVRALSHFIANTSQQGGKKVVLLGPVEQLNVNSANALLKSLEEPAGNTVLILVSHVLNGVMATIRSRCQLLPLACPSRPVALMWLEKLQVDDASTLLTLSGGAPLIAKGMVEGDYLDHLTIFINTIDRLSHPLSSTDTPDVGMARDWLPLSINHITEWWLQIIHSIVINATPQSAALTVNTNSDELTISQRVLRIANSGRQLNKQWLYKFSDKLLALRQQQLNGANPNMQLLVEELLLDWQVIIQRS
ncbi:MAG: DNA polymerase-3 subunit delta' [Candidatus Endobugula sp.]|jgi:DNA polymerase-3 subunit delta'